MLVKLKITVDGPSPDKNSIIKTCQTHSIITSEAATHQSPPAVILDVGSAHI